MPSTSLSQERDFVREITSSLEPILLPYAVEYISRNMNPEDVFPDKDLEYWAESNGYIKADN
jgi:hypothetical protein